MLPTALKNAGTNFGSLGLMRSKRARYVLRRLYLVEAVRLGELLEDDERCAADVLLAKILDACLTLVYGVDDEVVE